MSDLSLISQCVLSDRVHHYHNVRRRARCALMSIQAPHHAQVGPSHGPPSRRTPARQSRWGGPTGNERLTGATAVILLVLLALEGVTVVFLRPLFGSHVFLGMLLIPPVVLKIGSTGWRFVRYYTHSPTYRRKGAPPLVLRLIGPALVLSTFGVFASGVVMLIAGARSHPLVLVHKASFIVWLGLMAIHVLGHALRVPSLASADWRASTPRVASVAGSRSRRLTLALVLVAGVALALATLPLVAPLQPHGG